MASLYDRVEYVRGLRALGVMPESYGSLLSSVLVKKLPQELPLIVSRQISDDVRNMDDLMKSLEEELKSRERTAAAARESTGKRGAGPVCCRPIFCTARSPGRP